MYYNILCPLVDDKRTKKKTIRAKMTFIVTCSRVTKGGNKNLRIITILAFLVDSFTQVGVC